MAEATPATAPLKRDTANEEATLSRRKGAAVKMAIPTESKTRNFIMPNSTCGREKAQTPECRGSDDDDDEKLTEE
jgi:hypothetical protein